VRDSRCHKGLAGLVLFGYRVVNELCHGVYVFDVLHDKKNSGFQIFIAQKMFWNGESIKNISDIFSMRSMRHFSKYSLKISTSLKEIWGACSLW